MATEQPVAPTVRDPRFGPNVHTYIPRSDGAIIIGGVAYYPGGPTAVVASVPVTVVAPAPSAPVYQPATSAQVHAPPPQAYTSYPHPGHAGYAMNPAAPVYYQPYYNPLAMHPVSQSAPNFAQPAFGYMGATPTEVTAAGVAQAQGDEMSSKQEMKPADDDPFRFYWVRELDQSWSQRNRMTIDSGDIGECRWYAKDGTFYAVRLNMS